MTEEDFDLGKKRKDQMNYSTTMTSIMITLFIITFIIILIM